ncbi:spermidine synthase [Anoxybacillus vitaminiphilus]|uniref:Polyamine aminopropyltransferase n=1 Tax=Paranoxybacillus vitaminiphilus TaxID=581036 RepID=A0A327YCY6_9BACL|nr:polyamine aminopropyltransferase [Anoxybacillus vitaminiphilus]RAK18853.1 spermidine synthase [Anoxybacillus vitaminiphilus]
MNSLPKQLPPYIKNENGELWLTEDERENLKISYRIKDIIFSDQSPFQHVMILDSYDFGRMLVLDGVIQTTSIDGHIYNEMISHVPLQFHPSPKKVLIIGGGDCGAAREVAKYKEVEEIHMVEIDEMVVNVCKEHLTDVSGNLSDPRVKFMYTDGVAFIKEHANTYDVIIIDSSDPVGPAKELFSYEFYSNVYRALKDDGLMVCQSQSPIFHMDVLKQTHANINKLFPYSTIYTATVPTYPGGLWSFTIGSKIPLSLSESKLMPTDTKYVNADVLKQCFQLPQFMKQQLL